MNDMMSSIVTIAVAIIGVATLAVIVGANSKTVQVLQAGGNAFSGALGVAISPVTGGTNYAPQSFTMM